MVEEQSWTITQTLGSSIDVIQLDLYDLENTFAIFPGFDIVVEDFNAPAVRFFGGIITRVTYLSRGIYRVLRIQAADYTKLADTATIRRTYESIGQTDKSIIQDAFTRERPEINVSNVQEGRTISPMRFTGTSLSALLDQISSITAFVWRIDYFKQLHYKPLSYDVNLLTFSDTPNSAAAVASYPYYNPVIDHKLGDWNVVELAGAEGISDNVTDTYPGDGSTTVFTLGQEPGTVLLTHGPDDANDDNPYLFIQSDEGAGLVTRNVRLETDSGVILGINADVLWNPLTGRIEFDTAPANLATGFTVKGRYLIPHLTVAVDNRSVFLQGRQLRASIVNQDAKNVDDAYDRALAYLREHSDKILIRFTTNQDGLVPGSTTKFTGQRFNLTEAIMLINEVTIRLVGAETAEYIVNGEMVNYDLLRT